MNIVTISKSKISDVLSEHYWNNTSSQIQNSRAEWLLITYYAYGFLYVFVRQIPVIFYLMSGFVFTANTFPYSLLEIYNV